MDSESNEQLGMLTRWVLVAFTVLIGLVAVWLIRDVLMLALASVVLTVLISTPIPFFIRRGLNRQISAVLSIFLITVVVVLVIILLVPGLLQQFATLAGLIPRAIETVQQQIDSGELAAMYPWLEDLLAQVNIDVTSLGPIIEQVSNAVAQITEAIFPFVGGVAGSLLSLLVVLFMTLYFVATPDLYLDGLIKLTPKRYRTRAREIVARLNLTLRGFLQAKLTSMLLVGFGAFVGLTILGVPLSPALGTITGLLSFVPNFGPIAALIPTLAVTILNAPDRVLWAIAVIYGLVFIESQFVGPWLMSEQINLPPVMVLLGQIVAGMFFGFMGLLLAVPLTAIFMVLVEELYVKDILGDRGEELPHPPDEGLQPDGV